MEVVLQLAVPLVVVVSLLLLGSTVGRSRERRHFAELDRREEANRGFVLTDLRTVPVGMAPGGAALVTGATVIAADYLKTFLSGFRMIFGGEMRSYTPMIERARREARLRMVEDARRVGAMAVINVRFETSPIALNSGRNTAPMAEILCYGTALLPADR
ncbi:MAG TPA: heavy metal-binding domain-containing protein [Acidimicrobiia bacterium]|nr:heavy metal-binding domain-containing protein [Acidimicrobiia bacterium]